jgi:hypothetical protein
LRGECDLDPLAFFLHFASQLCIASELLCSLCETMAGSLSEDVFDLTQGQIQGLAKAASSLEPYDGS